VDDFFGENVILLVTIETTFRNKFNVAAFVFEDTKVTAADNTMRSEFNGNRKWRT